MEKKQEQQSGHESKRTERKAASVKIIGSSSINGDDASSLVGSIVEKGIVSNDDISKPIQPPRLSVLPFPVASHRSHGPHWTPRSNNRDIVEEDDEYESEFASFDPISVFAKPVQRKEKKNLDLSRWKEAMQSDDFSMRKGMEANKSVVGKTERKKMDGEALAANADIAYIESHLIAHRPLAKTNKAMRNDELSASSVTEMDLDDLLLSHQQEYVKDANSENISSESGSMAIDDHAMAERMFHNDSAQAQKECSIMIVLKHNSGEWRR
ncbi:transcriptional elongation regulator MINIYO-like [Hibiscus syriacus]|uniref:transcriptional elongation regulator MINIYO-like n=1 Tax=Hibiscus syriacus TaxID=106335 RepID=UPI0019228BC6|nr:transcriptional elongation regulator MINIYO-like [Hibiscus syriacus]